MSRDQVDLKLSRTIESYQGTEESPPTPSILSSELEEAPENPIIQYAKQAYQKYSVLGLYIIILVLISGYFIPRNSAPRETLEVSPGEPPAAVVYDENLENQDDDTFSKLDQPWKFDLSTGAHSDVLLSPQSDVTIHEAPEGSRLPAHYRTYSVNFAQHPSFSDFLDELDPQSRENVQNLCFENAGLDVMIDPVSVVNDLNEFEAFNVIALDCRDAKGHTIVAYLAVLNMFGDIQNVRGLKKRAEKFSMKNGETVLYTTAGEGGTYLWQWKTDVHSKLPFDVVASIQYCHASQMYFGAEVAPSGSQPRRVLGYNEEGKQVFSYDIDSRFGDAYIIDLTVEDSYVYITLSSNILHRVIMDTNEIDLTIGGDFSDVSFATTSPSLRSANPVSPWEHLKSFRYISSSGNLYILFDSRPDEEDSRVAIFEIEETSNASKDAFKVIDVNLGENSPMFGEADLLPSGNIFATSVPSNIDPKSVDRKYLANIWEWSARGEVAWRLGIRGPDPWGTGVGDPKPYSHFTKGMSDAAGWVISSAERIYSGPITTQICRNKEKNSIKLVAFNSAMTCDNMPGVAILYDKNTNEVIGELSVDYNKSWQSVPIEFFIPEDSLNNQLEMVVKNAWKEESKIDVGNFPALSVCTDSADQLEIRNDRIVKKTKLRIY